MPTGMAMYGTGSLPLAEKAINVIAIIVVTVFILFFLRRGPNENK
jgi:hypothetical protein